MVFSSLIFLFYFMPIVYLLHTLAPRKLKNVILLLSSLIFYSWGELEYLPLILISAFINYFLGLSIERWKNINKGKTLLIFSICLNVGVLFFFKYIGFFISNLNYLPFLNLPKFSMPLPLGISFYTFQILAYLVDIYKSRTKAERNILNYAVCLTMFPHMVAGPIVRYEEISGELSNRTLSLEKLQSGLFTFIMGLGSKVLLGNNIYNLWEEVSSAGWQSSSTPLAWMALLAYGFYIYFDFSGYSLMAIGLAKMLGFDFPQNFNYPYISKSITEFWRRWHMTLGLWFRDYIYIPLGGNRKGMPRQIFNLFVVWALTGFWHGASWNFVLWGLFFFVFIVIEKLFLLRHLEKSKVWSHFYAMFLVSIGWALFSISDFSVLKDFLSNLFLWRNGTDWIYYLRNYAIMFGLCFVLSTPILENIKGKLGKVKIPVCTIFAGAVFLLSVAYLVDSTSSPFLYFNF